MKNTDTPTEVLNDDNLDHVVGGSHEGLTWDPFLPFAPEHDGNGSASPDQGAQISNI